MDAALSSFKSAALRRLLSLRGGRGGDRRHRGVQSRKHLIGDVDGIARRKRGAGLEHDRRAAPLHHLLIDWAKLGRDLLLDVLLVALDLSLRALKLLSGLLLTGLERSDPRLQGRVWSGALKVVDDSLDRLLLGLDRVGECLFTGL